MEVEDKINGENSTHRMSVRPSSAVALPGASGRNLKASLPSLAIWRRSQGQGLF